MIFLFRFNGPSKLVHSFEPSQSQGGVKTGDPRQQQHNHLSITTQNITVRVAGIIGAVRQVVIEGHFPLPIFTCYGPGARSEPIIAEIIVAFAAVWFTVHLYFEKKKKKISSVKHADIRTILTLSVEDKSNINLKLDGW